MKEQVAIQRILQNRLTTLRTKNPSYSIRAFSKKVGISPGTLSLILLGKRTVSKKLTARMAEKLLLDPQERSEMLDHFPRSKAEARREGQDSVDPGYLQLTADQFHVVSDWYYFAILNLITLKNFQNKPDWIAKRLGLTLNTVEAALERLRRLDMITEDASGRLLRVKPRYRTTDDISNISLRKSHHQTLDLAKEALDSAPVDQRDFTWLTFPLDTRKIPLVKTMIRKFQDDLLAALGPDAECDEVYRLAIQLFSLTKGSRS